MLPINLFIVRHGESIGNLSKRKSEGGDNTLLERLRGTHTAHWPLTKKGVEQAQKTGAFLNRLIKRHNLFFDRMYVSDYARAEQTAGHLDLTGATWSIDTRITERGWGDFDRYTEDERRQQFAHALKMREVEPYYWPPPGDGGETFHHFLTERIHPFIGGLSRISIENGIVVCHGEVMKAFRMIFTQMQPWEYAQMEFSKESLDRIHNCQVDHYSRRNPKTFELSDRLEWLQVYRPSEGGDEPVIPWRNFPRRRFDSAELLEIAARKAGEFADFDL